LLRLCGGVKYNVAPPGECINNNVLTCLCLHVPCQNCQQCFGQSAVWMMLPFETKQNNYHKVLVFRLSVRPSVRLSVTFTIYYCVELV